MAWPDLVNGLFEALAGVAVLNNCRTLYQDKIYKGVSLLSVVFFTSWGFWNLYYYPHLQQILSFMGGLLIVGANSLWVGLMFYYRRYPGGRRKV